MADKIRLRFAPSPTGFLHIGGLRTALFDYLIAKSLGGTLFLRIEDTDSKREVEGAADKLIDVLAWAGIKFDEGPGSILGATNTINHTPRPAEAAVHPSREGTLPKDVGDYGPYVQSQRLEIYQKYTKELLDKGEAYYCFCTEERLTKMRADAEAMKKPPRYDRTCRSCGTDDVAKRIAAGEKFVIRHKLPEKGELIVHDELRGDLKFNLADLDDYVLIKSDGVPTYQFASVVDDHLMETSHVVRGEEWLPSLPKNISLYKSFGWQAPKFIHLPLVLDKNGGKLSKRKGDVAVEDFRAQGYLPEALINFNALLGWSPYAKASGDAASGQSNSEIFTMGEAIKVFDYHNIGTSPAIFNTEKLDYLNGIYIRKKSIAELIELCRPYLTENIGLTTDPEKKKVGFLAKVINLERERLKKLSEIGGYTRFFFIDNLVYDKAMLVWKKSTPETTKINLENLLGVLSDIIEADWQVKKIEEIVVAYIKTNSGGVGEYLWPMRVALTGEQASPSPFEMADALGKKETLDKIKIAIDKLT